MKDKIIGTIGAIMLVIGVSAIAVILIGYSSAMEQVALNEELQEEITTLEYETKVLREVVREKVNQEKEMMLNIEQLEEKVEGLKEDKASPQATPTRGGVARVTMYSPHDDRNGINSEGDPNITATGMQSGPDVIAVDPREIPYGSKVRVEGFDRTFIAGDTGGAMRNYDGVAIDIYTRNYDDALRFGIQYLEYTIVGEVE